jgi:hypothetical protein
MAMALRPRRSVLLPEGTFPINHPRVVGPEDVGGFPHDHFF